MIMNLQSPEADIKIKEFDHNTVARSRMIEQIRAMASEAYGNMSQPISEEILAVMERVPRHHFTLQSEQHNAYFNNPLPIGHGQTLLQPYIVALMTELLAPCKNDRVLEIGAGSGYQAAILAELAGEVFTMEIIKPLAMQAINLLDKLGYSGVHVKSGDGNFGWPTYAPFDGIIVTAGASHVPKPLLEQLKPGGRMVIPLGDKPYSQDLVLIMKSCKGTLQQKKVLSVSFAPLAGGN